VRLQSGESGEVIEIGMRSTRLLLPEGTLLIVPNAELANSRVVNESYAGATARCEVRVRVSWRADVERASAALLELALRQPEALDRPPPSVTVATLDRKGFELVLTLRVDGRDVRSAVEERLRRAIVERLQRGDEGITPEGLAGA
jgi:small-conductance mechanosensitive channel